MNITLSMLHDAELNAIKHDRIASTICLTFLKPDGATVEAVFEDVCGFRVVDYGQQNVVSRLLLSSTGHFSREDMIKHVNWLDSTCEGKRLINPNAVDKQVVKIESNELLLFALEPSLGAEISIIARRFFWGN